MLSDTAELARCVHRGDLPAAQKLLSEARHTSPAMRDGIRAADRDMGRDRPFQQLTYDPLTVIDGWKYTGPKHSYAA